YALPPGVFGIAPLAMAADPWREGATEGTVANEFGDPIEGALSLRDGPAGATVSAGTKRIEPGTRAVIPVALRMPAPPPRGAVRFRLLVRGVLVSSDGTRIEMEDDADVPVR